MRPTAQGFTLIELLVTLGLLATLIALFAPVLLTAGQGVSLTARARDLQSLLNDARGLAMMHHQSVFVCGASPAPEGPSLTLPPCDIHGEWRHGIHVVVEQNGNRSPDVDDSIQLYHPPYPWPITLSWRGFRGRQQIEFLAVGSTNWQNGRFTFCTKGQVSQELEVVLNAAGRTYIRPLTTPCSC